IDVRPAVALRHKQQPIASDPLPNIVAAKAAEERIVVSVARVPDFFPAAAARVNKPNGPWLQTLTIHREGVTDIRQANEGDAFAVRRPARRDIAVNSRCQKAQMIRARIVDCNE